LNGNVAARQVCNVEFAQNAEVGYVEVNRKVVDTVFQPHLILSNPHFIEDTKDGFRWLWDQTKYWLSEAHIVKHWVIESQYMQNIIKNNNPIVRGILKPQTVEVFKWLPKLLRAKDITSVNAFDLVRVWFPEDPNLNFLKDIDDALVEVIGVFTSKKEVANFCLLCVQMGRRLPKRTLETIISLQLKKEASTENINIVINKGNKDQ